MAPRGVPRGHDDRHAGGLRALALRRRLPWLAPWCLQLAHRDTGHMVLKLGSGLAVAVEWGEAHQLPSPRKEHLRSATFFSPPTEQCFNFVQYFHSKELSEKLKL